MNNPANIITTLTLLTIVISCNVKPSDRYVDIYDKKQHILELGTGEPIVIFISGAGSNLTHFDSVQKDISKITKTLSYDKAGLGKSEMINTPRTVENLTLELNEILKKEDFKDLVTNQRTRRFYNTYRLKLI